MKIGVYSISLAALVLAACGGDSGTNSGIAQAETVYGLGECEESNEGVIKLVTSDSTYYKCEDGDWEETEAPVLSSSSEKNPFAGSSGSNKSSVFGEKSSTSSGFFSADSKSGYNPINQTLTDSRDGQTYRTVKIGDQVWMAENLNYKTGNSSCGGCPYGRLYTWSDAATACPNSWHLPTWSECEALIKTVDGSITEYDQDNTAGVKLKSATGWNDSYGESGNGTDTFSFSAFPAGEIHVQEEKRTGDGKLTEFWSSTEYDVDYAYVISLANFRDNAYLVREHKKSKVSIRCLKDQR